MKLEDILPFVAPFARSLAEPTIQHHVKLAAVEFCSRTHVLTEELTLEGDGTATHFDLIPCGGLEVAKVRTVWVDDDEYDLADANRARRHIRASSYDEVAFSEDRQCLDINPAPKDGAVIVVACVVRPKLTEMRTIDDRLKPHLQDIAHGALSGLLALKGADRDMDMARANRSMFENRIATVGIQASRGFSRSRMRSAAQFF